MLSMIVPEKIKLSCIITPICRRKDLIVIMYIDKGGIREKGTHEELLEKKGDYYHLYMSQYDFL